MDSDSEWFDYERLAKLEDIENHMYQFCEDIIDATEHIENIVTPKEFEDAHLLKKSDDPKSIAWKEEIRTSLHYLREYQFNDKYTCGTLEIIC